MCPTATQSSPTCCRCTHSGRGLVGFLVGVPWAQRSPSLGLGCALAGSEIHLGGVQGHLGWVQGHLGGVQGLLGQRGWAGFSARLGGAGPFPWRVMHRGWDLLQGARAEELVAG
eukprot:365198-Chlamydomonas_euryale.AAC.10